MGIVHKHFTLYSDSPQRHYRQIAAVEEDGAFMFKRTEGTVLVKEPFEHENPDAEIIICPTIEKAIQMAINEREASLMDGWSNYHQTLD